MNINRETQLASALGINRMQQHVENSNHIP